MMKIDTTTVNKAQEKRDRQNYDFINADLRRKLLDFENKYLNSAVAYEFKILDNKIQHLEKVIAESKNTQSIANLETRLSRERRVRQLDATITLNAIVAAKKGYDQRVDKLTAELVKEGFGHAHYYVEQINTRAGELEFLISKKDKEVHARFIFVDGVIKAPHFRFITTVRRREILNP